MDTQTIQLVLTAVAAFALLLQTIFMIVILSVVMKAARNVHEEMEKYHAAVIPVLDKTRDVVEKTREIVGNVAPKIEEITDELTALTKSLSRQAADIQATANDVVERAHRQANRVDGILTAVFDRVEHAGVVMSDAVAKPMRQVSGLLASVKAAVDTLRDPGAGQPHVRQPVPPRYTDGEPVSSPRPTGTATSFRP